MEYSVDGKVWKDINKAKPFATGVKEVDAADSTYEVSFGAPVFARFIKIMPTDFDHAITMRAGLVGEHPC